MMQRFLGRLFFLLSIAYITGISNPIQAQVNNTTINGGKTCTGAHLAIPVMITSLPQVDTISLIVQYPSQTLKYNTYRQLNPAILGNGFISITENISGLIIRWASETPVTLTNGILLELVFNVGSNPGLISFDQVNSYYGDAAGNRISSSYSGGEITLFPRMSVTIEEIDATCPGNCQANVAAFVRGGTKPYQFLWNNTPSRFDSIKTDACGGKLLLKVTDANNCVIDTNFNVSVLEGSDIDVVLTPDTAYLQNPVINFSFTGDDGVIDWLWNFGDDTQASRERNPTHTYFSASNPNIKEYTATLKIVNQSGCDTTITIVIPKSEAKLFIPNVFTPNGDEFNNNFQITKVVSEGKVPIVTEFIRMELIVFDRWGRKVYENDNYKNDWDGNNLPMGTYFYRLNTIGMFNNETHRGGVTILR